MIVLIQQYTEAGKINRRVDCDHAHERATKDDVFLALYKNDKIVYQEVFTEKVRVFFMEHGKTVDSITFKVNT